MKKLYDFLQTHAVLFCIFFGATPYLPPVMWQEFGPSIATSFTWILLAASLILFLLCFWCLKATWYVMKPANMMAVFIASVLGLMISATALLAMYGLEMNLFLLCKDVPAKILQSAMVVTLLCQVFEVNPFAKSSG